MAIRTKPLEYAFPLSTAVVASGVARDFVQLAALAIPETTSRTIRSAILEVSVVDSHATAVNVTEVLIGFALGGVARSDANVVANHVASGENRSWLFQRDITAYMAANYTGTSMTADVRLTITGVDTINATAKLILTYESDDSAHSTRIKTVKIPVDGNIGPLTTGFVNLAGVANAFPALDTLLPEASKVYRNIFFQIDGHTGTESAGAGQLDLRFNGVDTLSDGSWGHTLNTDTYYRRIDVLTGIDTSIAHNIEAKTTSVTAKPMPCLNGHIVVTYEYDHAASTRVLNSRQEPVIDETGWMGGTTTTDKSRFTKKIFVQEANPTLVASGVQFAMIDAGLVNVDFRMGTQASRVYAHPATQVSGCRPMLRRLDFGETGGMAALTLVRGENTLVMDWFSTGSSGGQQGSNMSGLLFLNYTSDIHPDGDGVHAKTTSWVVSPHSANNLIQRKQSASSITPVIPEADYWITSAGYQIILIVSGINTNSTGMSVHAQVQAGEAEAAGWRSLYSGMYNSDSEAGTSLMWGRSRNDFKRWPLDTDVSRLDVETFRNYRFDFGENTAAHWMASALLTYHSIKYTISGTISDSGGGTVNVYVHRKDTGELVGSTSRSGNGAWSLTVYDDTLTFSARAYEDATHFGSSKEAIPGSGFDISMNTTGGSAKMYNRGAQFGGQVP